MTAPMVGFERNFAGVVTLGFPVGYQSKSSTCTINLKPLREYMRSDDLDEGSDEEKQLPGKAIGLCKIILNLTLIFLKVPTNVDKGHRNSEVRNDGEA